MEKIEYYWEKAGFTPNKSQKEAILHINGPLFLTAGPGSGKTRVLLWRTLNLIVFHNIDPAEIFLSTFTEKAARQLQDGLRSLLGIVTNETGKPYDIASMSIGTVHSLCQKLLVDRRFNPDPSRRRAPVLIDELGQYFRIYKRNYWKSLLLAGGYDDEEAGQRTINDFFSGRDSYSRHVAAQNCISLFNRFSEESVDPDSVQTEDKVLQSLLSMYSKYRKDLKTDDNFEYVDFSVLQQSAYKYFTGSHCSRNVFRHIIIDEYQDTNSIQEKIFFQLAGGSRNIYVVGDDDQSLYRFRGAAVENLVRFEERCNMFLGKKPKRIDLSINYRSRKKIVDFYTDFITRTNWLNEKKTGEYYRIHDKEITAYSRDDNPSVVTTSHAKADIVYHEVAQFIKQLKKNKVITDYNQVAFLFPAMKGWRGMNSRVHGYIKAFQEENIPYYAPRAGRFLEVEEAQIVFGLFQFVFGKPLYRDREDASRGYREYQNWLTGCREKADELRQDDSKLDNYLKDREKEFQQAKSDFESLLEQCEKQNIELKESVTPGLTAILSKSAGLSLHGQKALRSHSVNQSIKKRFDEGNPYSINYLLNRVTALDWSILDLFYQLNGFDYFRTIYRLSETGEDEGPICNLGLITQYLARYMEEYSPILTGQSVIENRFVNSFFGSFLYALFRLGESEYEDTEDPFPKGRVPFLTIHQSKGLELPVVVLGSVYREERDPSVMETSVRVLLKKEGEPLSRISKYDSMRIFYVGLSRAQNLLILPRYTHNKAASPEFKEIIEEGKLSELRDLELSSIPKAERKFEELGKSYNYTGDYLLYKKCPRNYMIYRKYGFVPSRGQTMFFGRLIHETIEDLHHIIMKQKEVNK